MALAAAPALDGNHSVPLPNNVQFQRFRQTKLDAVVHIFLPPRVAVGVRKGVVEGVGTAIQMAGTRRVRIASH